MPKGFSWYQGSTNWDDRKRFRLLTPNERYVFDAMVSTIQLGSVTFVTPDKLARLTDLHIATVYRALKSLQRHQFIMADKEGGKRLYKFNQRYARVGKTDVGIRQADWDYRNETRGSTHDDQ